MIDEEAIWEDGYNAGCDDVRSTVYTLRRRYQTGLITLNEFLDALTVLAP